MSESPMPQALEPFPVFATEREASRARQISEPATDRPVEIVEAAEHPARQDQDRRASRLRRIYP